MHSDIRPECYYFFSQVQNQNCEQLQKAIGIRNATKRLQLHKAPHHGTLSQQTTNCKATGTSMAKVNSPMRR